MNKTKQFLLICCLMIAAVFGKGANTISNDGISIAVILLSSHSGPDRSNAIVPVINGHVLTVSFTDDLGLVSVDVTTSSGSPVDYTTVITPNGIQFYIPNTGNYIVTFTLPNGDEYYGEFLVTD
jgi:hypothetical protein